MTGTSTNMQWTLNKLTLFSHEVFHVHQLRFDCHVTVHLLLYPVATAASGRRLSRGQLCVERTQNRATGVVGKFLTAGRIHRQGREPCLL